MTDKELLELAAKAAGWKWWQSKHGYWNVENQTGESMSCCVGWSKFDQFTGEALLDPTPYDALMECGWNPLIDDGDALRLAVKLNIPFHSNPVWSEVFGGVGGIVEQNNGDPYAATRRAIVRAAAKIGKTL